MRIVLPALSLNEWTVLCLLAEQPAHGFALARQLEPTSDLGRIMTVRRPLVYRALDRVVGAGLAQPHLTEPGAAGPNRTRHRITSAGRAASSTWLSTPVAHVRDLRIEFLVKMRLNNRSGNDPSVLVRAQRGMLSKTLEQLSEANENADVVDQWRRQNAIAVSQFLAALDHEPTNLNS
jgi:DNA-binding PadR family transcriptional regulator